MSKLTISGVTRSRPSSLLRVAPIALLACASDCTSFPEIPRGSCGNAVVDPGEDCDGFPRGDGTACGAPGSASACRLTCSFASGGPTCPPGWGCSAEGICRQPTGTFARRPESIVAGAWRVALADFDGDHRLDVLTRGQVDARGFSKLRAHYFDRDMALATTTVLPKKVGSPVTRDIDGDGHADLLFTLNAVDSSLAGLTAGALDVMLGETDRSFSPVAYPTFVFPQSVAQMYPVKGFPGSPARVVVFSGGAQGTAIAHPDTATGSIGVMVALPKGPDALASPAVPANLNETTPCDELVWGYSGAGEVSVLSACKRELTGWVWNDGGTPTTIALPGGATVSEGVRVADVDADTHLDVLIGAGGKTYVASGDGIGGFAAARPLTIPIYLTRGSTTPYPLPLPLAIADVSGDGKPDFVTPQLVLTSIKGDPNGGYAIAAYKTPGVWSAAATVDINADGHTDVVAGTSTDLDLDLFVGTGTFTMNPFTIPTFGTTAQLQVGDVDGDLVSDVVLAQGSPGAEDALAIVFGKPGAVPDAPTTAGRFGRIGQTVTVDLGAGVDAIGVIYYSTDTKDTAVRIALLSGSGDRLPLAPFALTTPMGTPGVPFGVVAGAFTRDANLDFVALAGDQPAMPNAPFSTFRLWTSVASAPAKFDTATPGDPIAGMLHPVGGLLTAQRAAALMTSGDVDGDGLDEVVALMPNKKDETCALVIAKPKSAGAGASTAFGDPIELPLAVGSDGELALLDMDGDGALDVVVLAGRDATRRLSVLWNDGHGGFSPARATDVADANDRPNDFGFVRVAAGARPAIAYVTRTTLVVAKVAPDHGVTRATLDTTLAYATGVAGGDVDGDGVDDLAVADTPSLVVYKGTAALK